MEILDLLDELEVMIKSGKRHFYMHQKSIIVDQGEVLDQIEAIRQMVHDKYQLLKASLSDTPSHPERSSLSSRDELDGDKSVKKARQKADMIQQEIDDYADKVLENLKLTVMKFKRKLVKLDSVLDVSRERIKRSAIYHKDEEE